jgi:flagellar basal body-associated protein FliL
MSSEQPKPDAPAPDAAAPKKKSSKLVPIVAVLMIVQGVAVFMVAKMTGPKAAAAAEADLHGAPQDDGEVTVELPLIEDQFQNMQTGRAWIWDVSIVLQVPAKNQAHVEELLENRAGELAEGVAQIFRRAQNNQLREPGLESLNRQIHAFVNQVFGKDAQGKDRVKRVLIPKCKGFPAE